MTALERAKRFVQQKAATTALVIVPLAVAGAADASPILNPTGETVTFTGLSPTSGSYTLTQFPTGGNGVRFAAEYDFNVSSPSGGSFFIELALSGTGNGLLDVPTIPAHYDYLFAPSDTISDFESTIKFLINGIERGSGGPHGVSGNGDPALSGWLPTQSLSSWGAVLRAEFFAAAGSSTIHLSIPALASIDIVPAG